MAEDRANYTREELMRLAMSLGSLALLAGCATPAQYSGPAAQNTIARSKVLQRDFDAAWAKLIPRLSERFFVVNTIDKASGLISLSYSGDPERYVDCGVVTFNGQTFKAAVAQVSYRSDAPLGPPTRVERTMHLDGRINFVVQKHSAEETKATVNVMYSLTRTAIGRNVISGIVVGHAKNSITFNSAMGASFPPFGSSAPVACTSTGELERELLAALD